MSEYDVRDYKAKFKIVASSSFNYVAIQFIITWIDSVSEIKTVAHLFSYRSFKTNKLKVIKGCMDYAGATQVLKNYIKDVFNNPETDLIIEGLHNQHIKEKIIELLKQSPHALSLFQSIQKELIIDNVINE